MAKVSEYDDEGVGAFAYVPADQIRAVLVDAVCEIGDLPLFKNEERLAVAILEGLERSVQTLPERGRLDAGQFAEVVEQVRLLLPKLPSRSSALVPQIRQLVASLEDLRPQDAAA